MTTTTMTEPTTGELVTWTRYGVKGNEQLWGTVAEVHGDVVSVELYAAEDEQMGKYNASGRWSVGREDLKPVGEIRGQE